MLYRKVEKTGDELSSLGFGCMRLPTTRLMQIDEPRATRQLREAIDQGVNYVDTALPYHGGASEPFVARALRDGYRDRVKVATKLPPWNVRKSEDMETLFCSQLERLEVEQVDYYLLHALDRQSWPKMLRRGALEYFDQLRTQGRIANAGFSFHGDKDLFTEIIDAFDWDFCQIQYSFLDEHNQAGTEGLEYAASKGIGVIVMEPLRGGNLSGRVPAEVQALWDEAETRRTPAEWALRWVWNRPEVTCVLSGMNEEAHIAENLRVASEAEPGALSAAELELVERVRDAYYRLTKADCTGCRYCMPCPHGVDIPRCFEVYNNFFMFPEDRGGKFMYPLRLGAFTGEPSYASFCTKCKKCVKKCPQGLPIPELLDDVVATFEGPGMRALIWVAAKGMGVYSGLTLRAARRAERRRGGRES